MFDVFKTFQTALGGFYDVPEGMEQIVKYVNQRYENVTIYVTENGEWHIHHKTQNAFPVIFFGYQ
jgi:hypothetical protein